MEPVAIDHIYDPGLKSSEDIPSKKGIRMVTYNVHGYTDRHNMDTRNEIIEFLKTTDADFICLQEHRYAIEPIDQYNHTSCDYEMYQLVIYYKQNMENIKIHRYDIGNGRCMVGVSTNDMMIVNIHLSPNLTHGIEQMIVLSNILRSSEYAGMNICLCGDFNAYDRSDYDDQRMKQLIAIKSKYYGKTDMDLIFRSIDRLKQMDFVNSFALNNSFRPMNTTCFGGNIDFIFVRLQSKYTVAFTNVQYIDLSDHLPVYCDLMEHIDEKKTNDSIYLQSIIDYNLIELAKLHEKFCNPAEHRRMMTNDRYGDTWFHYDNEIHTINTILTAYKTSGFFRMNRFISVNTIGDIFAPPRDMTIPDADDPLISCVDEVINSIDKKANPIIADILQYYINMYINDMKNPLIHEIIDTRIKEDSKNSFLKLKNINNHNWRRRLLNPDLGGFDGFDAFYKYLKDHRMIPIAGFVRLVEQFIRDGKCTDNQSANKTDNLTLLMNVFLNKFILQLSRNPNPFVTYRTIRDDMARSRYYDKMFIPGAVIPLSHIQSTGLIPFYPNKEYYEISIMLEIHVPANFPAFYGFMSPVYSMESSEILLPYCDNIEGNELSYAYRTRSYENKTTKRVILFDENQADLPEITENIAKTNTENILLINADTSQTPPKIYMTCVTHYVVVDIIRLETPIPLRYIPSETYDAMAPIPSETAPQSHIQSAGYYDIYQSHKHKYRSLMNL